MSCSCSSDRRGSFQDASENKYRCGVHVLQLWSGIITQYVAPGSSYISQRTENSLAFCCLSSRMIPFYTPNTHLHFERNISIYSSVFVSTSMECVHWWDLLSFRWLGGFKCLCFLIGVFEMHKMIDQCNRVPPRADIADVSLEMSWNWWTVLIPSQPGVKLHMQTCKQLLLKALVCPPTS